MTEETKCCTSGSGACKCCCHMMVPVLIVLIAAAFLLQAFEVLSQGFVAIAWPILLGLIGLNKLMSRFCKCCC